MCILRNKKIHPPEAPEATAGHLVSEKKSSIFRSNFKFRRHRSSDGIRNYFEARKLDPHTKIKKTKNKRKEKKGIK